MSGFHASAPKPPMGWNSWGCVATRTTEAQVKAQADYMATHLAKSGWQHVVVGDRWYEPGATGCTPRPIALPALDAHGRLLPAANRFPSCAGGFAPLAAYVHRLGLKFGVHLLRGVPRSAIEANSPILGSASRARDIANPDDTLPGNPDTCGVDMSAPGAQAYYDSVFAAFAEWGVDYVKVVGIGRPYHVHAAEIEAIRRAIERAGRPMVLSLSPGASAPSAAEDVPRQANPRRMSDDVWDSGDVLREQLATLADWNAQRVTGCWPDPDMLPFGALGHGRRSSRFTPDEQRCAMTLWAIARAPLMYGGDMTKMDELTLGLLTQAEVIALNQDSRDNRLLFDDAGLVAWAATGAAGACYLALFNARDRFPLSDELCLFAADLEGGARALQSELIDVPVAPGTIVQLVADGGGDQHSVVWGDPVFQGPGRELSLLDLPWEQATSRRGGVTCYRAPGERELLLGGRPLDRGLLVHTPSAIACRVPEGCERLVVECGFEGSALPRGARAVARCSVYRAPEAGSSCGETPLPPAEGVTITVHLGTLGLEGEANTLRAHVLDVWSGADLGVFETVFSRTIPWHGAGLFRLRPLPR